MLSQPSIIIIGGGPAGLMAAEVLAAAGKSVTVYERKPSVGRKFLMAGRGGLNLTHSEPLEIFMTRYGAAQGWLEPVIKDFSPALLQEWCQGLGQPVFIGSSGRIFPKSFKSSPLLRAWIARLESAGVRFVMSRAWTGWEDQRTLRFIAPDGTVELVHTDATLLALGGASWPKLGSDGGWVEILKRNHVTVAPLRPANCGFAVAWSDVFRKKFAGQPLKSIALSFDGVSVPGEIMVARNGIEGSAVYALSAAIREALPTALYIDLRPGLTTQAIAEKLKMPRGRHSFSNYLRRALGLSPVAIGILREVDRNVQNRNPKDLAALIKAVPLQVSAPFSLERAISTAGGIKREALDENFMIKALPGVFAAGEMLDWEAPTGGYLLQASFATGHAAAQGLLKYTGI